MMQRHALRHNGHEAAGWVDGPHTRPRRAHPGVEGDSCEHRHRDLGRDARRALPDGWACGRGRRSRSVHPGVEGDSCEHRHRDLGRDARRALPDGWACGRGRRSRSAHPGVEGGSCERRHRDLGRDARRARPGERTGARFSRHSPGADGALIDRHGQNVH
jgi:hypothetical protein